MTSPARKYDPEHFIDEAIRNPPAETKVIECWSCGGPLIVPVDYVGIHPTHPGACTQERKRHYD